MPTYLITYHGGPGMPSDPESARQVVAAFQGWVAEAGDAVRDPGAPLGLARTVAAGSERDGQAEAQIGGYTLVDAASLDEAVRIVGNHPFLTRGGSLQVSESVSPGA